jgi:hypothetical protein
MFAFTRHRFAKRLRTRRSICAVLLVGFGITAAGIPLPGPQKQLNSRDQFPCAGSSCGCRSATQCWESCCCSTLAERIAWARRNGVRPPEFAIAQARAAKFDLAWLESHNGSKACDRLSCCDAKNKIAKPPVPARSCCSARTTKVASRSAHSCCSHMPVAHEHKSKRYDVIGFQALKCGGHSLDWLAAVPSLAGSQPIVHFDGPPCAWHRPVATLCVSAAAEPPLLPPPERA